MDAHFYNVIYYLHVPELQMSICPVKSKACNLCIELCSLSLVLSFLPVTNGNRVGEGRILVDGSKPSLSDKLQGYPEDHIFQRLDFFASLFLGIDYLL